MNQTLSHLVLALVPSRRLAARLGFTWRPRVLAALPPALLVAFLVWSGWLYPLRPDTIGTLGHPFTGDPGLAGAWGGPTLVGAWFVHAMVALGMQVICMALIRLLHGRARVSTV